MLAQFKEISSILLTVLILFLSFTVAGGITAFLSAAPTTVQHPHTPTPARPPPAHSATHTHLPTYSLQRRICTLTPLEHATLPASLVLVHMLTRALTCLPTHSSASPVAHLLVPTCTRTHEHSHSRTRSPSRHFSTYNYGLADSLDGRGLEG